MSSMYLSGKKRKDNRDDLYLYANNGQTNMVSTEELRKCRQTFKIFDSEGSDTLTLWEARLCLESLGLYPSEINLHAFLLETDTKYMNMNDTSNVNGPVQKIDFPAFMNVYHKQKQYEKSQRSEDDLILSFVAMGGNTDKSGKISLINLQKVLKDDFGLSVKIDDLIEELDTDEKDITFQQFTILFG